MLSLSPEENELGHNAESVYERFGAQIRAFKLEAACQAEECSQKEAQEKAKSTEVDTKEDADADGEVEEVALPQHTKGKHVGGRIIVSLYFRFLHLTLMLSFRNWPYERAQEDSRDQGACDQVCLLHQVWLGLYWEGGYCLHALQGLP
jgi:hypothetical protein